jgi:hypothetical protein
VSGDAHPRALEFHDEIGQFEGRLPAFRAACPDVLIGGGQFGTWQAIIPEENGETIVVRYLLRELLDRVEEIMAPVSQQTP